MNGQKHICKNKKELRTIRNFFFVAGVVINHYFYLLIKR